MVADNFMWFPDQNAEVKIEGETSDEWFRRRKAFEVESFTFTMEQEAEASVTTPGAAPAAAPGKSSGGGKAKFQKFTIDKPVDLASAMLYKACSKGSPLASAMLAIRKVGGSNLLYLQYIFRDVRVVGITWSGGSGDRLPKEAVTLSFKAMGFQYTQQGVDGKELRKLNWSWNTAANEGSPTLDITGLGPPPSFVLPTQA